mmetsp:Transcript_22796/g.47807  ORF Transcript_22796/g.47807 Transcript_22796/m.47807 type:complete len:352 (-) Transcript_22796:161-1216(-)
MAIPTPNSSRQEKLRLLRSLISSGQRIQLVLFVPTSHSSCPIINTPLDPDQNTRFPRIQLGNPIKLKTCRSKSFDIKPLDTLHQLLGKLALPTLPKCIVQGIKPPIRLRGPNRVPIGQMTKYSVQKVVLGIVLQQIGFETLPPQIFVQLRGLEQLRRIHRPGRQLGHLLNALIGGRFRIFHFEQFRRLFVGGNGGRNGFRGGRFVVFEYFGDFLGEFGGLDETTGVAEEGDGVSIARDGLVGHVSLFETGPRVGEAFARLAEAFEFVYVEGRGFLVGGGGVFVEAADFVGVGGFLVGFGGVFVFAFGGGGEPGGFFEGGFGFGEEGVAFGFLGFGKGGHFQNLFAVGRIER